MGGVFIAIYSLNIKIQSRGKGKSAIAAAAYIAGERIKNEYDGLTHDRTDRKDVVFTEIMLPENAPDHFTNRTELWNAVELSERAKNAQLCRSLRIALPKEFTLEQNINLVQEYVNENFVSRGMVADIAIHDKGDGNPHAHVLLTMRPLEKDGTFGAKSRMEYILDGNGERIKLPSGRYKTKKITTTDWDDRGNAELWRKNWADTLNKYLEYYDHEIRVDHRSYERQGLEILPTIHLGAVAHALEQKGIASERGNINRAIIAENERIKNINKEICKTKKERHDILNPPKPPKPKFIIDIENCIKAKESPGYEHWARIFNIQQMAKTLIFIQEQGYTDMQSLRTAYINSVNDLNGKNDKLREVKIELQNLKELKKQAEIYRKTADTYKKYNAPKQLAYFKNQFYEKHKADIEAHKTARAYIYDKLKLTKFPSLKKLSADITELTATEKQLQQDIPTAREKYNSLNIANYNAKLLLGYRDLELQNINPAILTKRAIDMPICKLSFNEARKADSDARSSSVTTGKQGNPINPDKLTEYYQNLRINNDCIAEMAQAISQCKKEGRAFMAEDVAISRAVEKFGEERVEWVLAVAVSKTIASEAVTTAQNTDTSKFSEHREWASQQNLPNEPHNISSASVNAHLSGLIKEFKDYVQMQAADIAWQTGQAHTLSFADRMAVAGRKSDEYNQSRETTVPKQKKSKGMEI